MTTGSECIFSASFDCTYSRSRVAATRPQDYFLSEVKVEPLMVVGYEGLFGVAAMAVILSIVQFLPGQEGTGTFCTSLLLPRRCSCCPVVMIGLHAPVSL